MFVDITNCNIFAVSSILKELIVLLLGFGIF